MWMRTISIRQMYRDCTCSFGISVENCRERLLSIIGLLSQSAVFASLPHHITCPMLTAQALTRRPTTAFVVMLSGRRASVADGD